MGLKCARMRLAAGLPTDPLGELKRSPRPPSRNWGVPTSKEEGREGMGNGRKGMGRGKGRMGGERGLAVYAFP